MAFCMKYRAGMIDIGMMSAFSYSPFAAAVHNAQPASPGVWIAFLALSE